MCLIECDAVAMILRLPCLITVCHAYSDAVVIFNRNSVCHAYPDAVSMFNEMQLPCLMQCTSTGHVGVQMLVSNGKCYVVAMFAEMQLPC